MASKSARFGLLGAVLLLAGASAAQAATFNVTWGFNTTAVFVPELAITCGDSVSFRIGANQTHDVTQVVPVVPSMGRFPSVCNASVYQTELARQSFTAPYTFTKTFTDNGVFYYICSVRSPRDHCSFGKMAVKITVLGDCPVLPPSPPPRRPGPPVPGPPRSPPPPAPSVTGPPQPGPPTRSPPPPARTPETIVQPWSFGVNASSPLTVQCGDTVVFRSPGGQHSVIEVDRPECGGDFVHEWKGITNGAYDAPVLMDTEKTRTFICTVNNHCADGGMILNVITTGC